MRCNYLYLLIIFFADATLAADKLGRLFLTPEQRAQLEIVRAQRDRRLPITLETEPAPVAPVAQGPEIVTYDGMVRRSDGKSTVWINGKPVNERNRIRSDNEVSVTGLRRDGAVSVAIPLAERKASLKVGQRLDVNSGKINESYVRRTTPINPLLHAPVTSVASPVVTPSVATAAATAKPARPVRESDTKEADPNSGAAPAVRLPGK